jgi:hypothetical protein
MNSVVECFIKRFQEGLKNYPALQYRWADLNGGAQVVFPKLCPTGFDVIINISDKEIMVSTELGAHDQFPVGSDPSEAVENALGMTRALLSADTRVREFRAGGRPYRWVIEYKEGEAWRKGAITGLLFWHYFSKRTQHIYQNGTLPGRDRITTGI